MAQPTTFSFKKLLVMLGDGGTPETFLAPCGLNSKGLNFTKDTNDTTVPDCDAPDAPAWTQRAVVSQAASISGSGILAAEAHATWRSAYLSTDPVNCRIKIDDVLANGGGYYEGAFHLTTFNITGSRGDFINVEVALQSSGEVVWHPASA